MRRPVKVNQSPMPDKIIVLITHGFRVRNILYTDLWKELRSLGEVTLLCPDTDVESLAIDIGCEARVEGYSALKRSRLEDFFTGVRKNVLTHPKRNTTVNIFNLNDRYKSPVKYRFRTLANSIFGRSKLLRDLWLAMERRVFPGHEFDGLIRRLAPSLVITTDYASHAVEIRLLRAAHRDECPTVSIVYSWDNLSSKGIMGEVPGSLVVWNQIMAGEADEFHQYPRSRVHVTGAAQFDVYFRKDLLASREECCRRWGLDPARPILTFGTITAKFFPYSLEVLEMLLEARAKGDIPADLQILVRLHPQTMQGEHRDEVVEKIIALAGKIEGLHINMPAVRCWGSLYSPVPNDQKELAEILRHSVAVMHPGSTLSIDAAAMDCPIIGIAFDGRQTLPYGLSIRRFWDFGYMVPVIESGGVDLVRSGEELNAAVTQACRDRSRKAAQRKALAARLCAFTDGRSAERVGSVIRATLETRPRRDPAAN